MTTCLRLCFALLFVSTMVLKVQAQSDQAIAFVGVTVVPMTSERLLPDQTVIVQDGRIVAMGAAAYTRVPDGALRVEAQGQYLMPGLAEMHGHVPSSQAPAELVENILFLYLATGITTVRGMLGSPGQLALRERVNRGELLAPTLYLAGPSLNGNSVQSPEHGAQMVRDQKAAGWDLLKIHPGLSMASYQAIATTAEEVGLTFGGHVPQAVGVMAALENGQETFDHIDGYAEYLNAYQGPIDEAKLAEVVQATREAGAWIVPTMALWETIFGGSDLETLQSYPELKYVPENMVGQWTNSNIQRRNNPNFNANVAAQLLPNRLKILKALHDGGVPILMGTDAPQEFSVPGFSLHRELQVMAEAGLTPYQILQTGTAHVGRYFAHKDQFGTIEVGHRADLVLVEANPLADIANASQVAGVMVRGRWISQTELQQRLAAIATTYAREGE